MGLDTDLDLMKIVGGPDFVWGPTVGPTGDPDILYPSEGQMMYQLPSPKLLGEEILWLCIIITEKGRNLSHELPNQLQRCCVHLGKFHELPSQPQS